MTLAIEPNEAALAADVSVELIRGQHQPLDQEA